MSRLPRLSDRIRWSASRYGRTRSYDDGPSSAEFGRVRLVAGGQPRRGATGDSSIALGALGCAGLRGATARRAWADRVGLATPGDRQVEFRRLVFPLTRGGRETDPNQTGLSFGSIAITMAGGPSSENAVIAGFYARPRGLAHRTQAQSQQFTNRSSPCWHPVLESKVINDGQLFRRKHDLQSLTSEVVHGSLCPAEKRTVQSE